MRILIACEESQTVCKSFREKGHESFSCDILPCSGGHPEWHIISDGDMHTKDIVYDGRWDILIAHPPCTYLANSGVRWLHKQPQRKQLMYEGAIFFKMFLHAPIEKICIENPIMHKYAKEIIGADFTQSIQPYQFGHAEVKRTCLWLKGLPPLLPTSDLKSQTFALPNNERQRLHYLPPSKDRAKLRSKTYIGIAKAMAEQWR